MRDLDKYNVDDLRNYCTRLEAKIAGYKIEIQELKDKLQKERKERGKDSDSMA